MKTVSIEEAKAAVNGFFSNSKNPRAVTRDGLVELIEECRTLLQALDEDAQHEREEEV